jgi:hypothetical protein
LLGLSTNIANELDPSVSSSRIALTVKDRQVDGSPVHLKNGQHITRQNGLKNNRTLLPQPLGQEMQRVELRIEQQNLHHQVYRKKGVSG